MDVIAFFPSTGIIASILVRNSFGQYQVLTKQSNWYMSDSRWGAEAVKAYHLKAGYSELPRPMEFDFFIKNIQQFER